MRHEGGLQQDMVSVRISGPVPLAFVSAPAYLRGRRASAIPADLEAHRCLCYRYTSSGTIHRWEFEHGGKSFQHAVRQAFVTNDVDVLRDAAVAGMGVACLPHPHVEQHLGAGTLVALMPGWAPTLLPNHLYYPSRRQPSAAFRAFVEALSSWNEPTTLAT